jgi:hypothetical protein
MKKSIIVAFAFFVFFGCARVQAALPSVYTLKIGEHTARVELAITNAERSRGLMFRESLEEDSGMLFIFNQPDMYSFWMRNTFIPLSIAFIDQHGWIVNIEEMVPHDERLVFPKAAVLYALEMTAGWFAQKGIKPGMQVVFDEKILKRVKK